MNHAAIQVRFVAQLRQAAGRHEQTVSLPSDTTLAGLLRALADEHGEPLRSYLLAADGSPRPSLLVSIGGRQAPRDSAWSLSPGDVVTLMAPMSGG